MLFHFCLNCCQTRVKGGWPTNHYDQQTPSYPNYWIYYIQVDDSNNITLFLHLHVRASLTLYVTIRLTTIVTILSYTAQFYTPNIHTPPLYLYNFVICLPYFFKPSLFLFCSEPHTHMPCEWEQSETKILLLLCYAAANQKPSTLSQNLVLAHLE